MLVAGVVLSVIYTIDHRNDETAAARSSFASTVDTMEQVSSANLRMQQETVASWGKYINKQSLTMNEALVLLRNMNSNDNISAHIIDVDTYQGSSTAASVIDEYDYSVNYSYLSDELQEMLKKFISAPYGSDGFKITGAYTNPIDGKQSVGFAEKIYLKDDNGDLKSYLLLRVMPVDVLQEQWVFPTGYDDAEMGLITISGDYVIRSKSMKSENFFEFIRAYNGLTYPESDALAEEVRETGSGVLEYDNARGERSYWVYVPVDENSDWFVIGYCPESSLIAGETEWGLVIFVCVTLGFLFIIDGAYFIYINKRLSESVKEAERANKAKTDFLSSMSHDIRTPMNAVVGMTTVAMRNIDDKEHVIDCLTKIELASNHLLTLINDILDISKIESNKFVLNPTAFSMARLMMNLTNIVRPQITAKHQDFKVHIIHFRQEYLYADELRLNQIFINILGNAVKYTPEYGHITLTLEEQPGDKLENGIRIIYTVEDDGIGMSDDLIKDLFKPFVRAADSRVSKIEGSGLGLAITGRMVQAMDGNITVKSKLGEGSTFTVTMELPATENTDELMLPKMDMLVVDDDEIFLEATADELRSLGVKPDTVTSGRKAVDMAVEKHNSGEDYPVIIVDWKMPEMDGIATIKEIRSKIGDEVPIVILSAFDWADIEQEAIAAGASGFISKPVFRSSLYTKITELMDLGTEKPVAANKVESFDGMHLLVAEDNDLNWDIISQILEFYNVTADRAENGQVCVEMVNNAPEGTYKAIFMDVQMPVMDGREATRNIRKSDKDYVRTIPIIAMTADAFAEDVKTCMDAGMNAHMAKPIDMKQLEDKLIKIRDGEYL